MTDEPETVGSTNLPRPPTLERIKSLLEIAYYSRATADMMDSGRQATELRALSRAAADEAIKDTIIRGEATA